jgi:hypothetical protein
MTFYSIVLNSFTVRGFSGWLCVAPMSRLNIDIIRTTATLGSPFLWSLSRIKGGRGTPFLLIIPTLLPASPPPLPSPPLLSSLSSDHPHSLSFAGRSELLLCGQRRRLFLSKSPYYVSRTHWLEREGSSSTPCFVVPTQPLAATTGRPRA